MGDPVVSVPNQGHRQLVGSLVPGWPGLRTPRTGNLPAASRTIGGWPLAQIRRSASDELALVRQALAQVHGRYPKGTQQPEHGQAQIPAWRSSPCPHPAATGRGPPIGYIPHGIPSQALCPWHPWAEICTLRSATDAKPHAAPVRGSSVDAAFVRGRPWKPTVTPTVLTAARRPLYVRGQRNTTVHSATR
jgi:hypothetical protein